MSFPLTHLFVGGVVFEYLENGFGETVPAVLFEGVEERKAVCFRACVPVLPEAIGPVDCLSYVDLVGRAREHVDAFLLGFIHLWRFPEPAGVIWYAFLRKGAIFTFKDHKKT